MAISDEVTVQLKDAMRAKDQRKLSALRSMRTAFLNEMKKDGSESISDEACETILRRLGKQRKESIEAFSNAGRDEMADAERAELVVIEQFLPQLADEALTREWVQAAISESGASSPKEMGKAMGALMKAHKADIDGALARDIMQELLG